MKEETRRPRGSLTNKNDNQGGQVDVCTTQSRTWRSRLLL